MLNNKKNKILVVSVHPDDETLGCGGTLLRHKNEGDEIYWLNITDIKNYSQFFSKEQILVRSKEIEKVKDLYQFDGTNNLQLQPSKIDKYSDSELIELISDYFKEISPNVIYLPYKYDVHSDHRKIFECVYSCTKVFRYSSINKIYMMEILSETDFAPSINGETFVPNVFVNIEKYIDKKIEIMKIYKSEIKDHPFPRSEENIKALATYRGGTSGFKYAESFMLLKEIR